MTTPPFSELHDECIDKLFKLHNYDCLRANKSMMASSVEVRVPFLDPGLLDVVMTIPVGIKHPKFITHNGRPIEKGLLRRACHRDNLLPDSVLWRQKEQFSDSVGYSWIDGIKDHCASNNCNNCTESELCSGGWDTRRKGLSRLWSVRQWHSRR